LVTAPLFGLFGVFFRDGLGLSDTIYRIPSARKELGLFVFTLYLSLIYMTYPLEWIYISFVLKTMKRTLLVRSDWQKPYREMYSEPYLQHLPFSWLFSVDPQTPRIGIQVSDVV